MPPRPSPEMETIADSILAGRADATLRLYGAKGLLPLAPDERVRVFLALRADPDGEISAAAEASVRGAPADDWLPLISPRTAERRYLEAAARFCGDSIVLEAVARHPNTPSASLIALAGSPDPAVQDALVVNQERLLRMNELVEALLANPALLPDCRRRLNELKEEFFEKAVRREARRLADRRGAAEELEPAPAEVAESAGSAEPSAGGEPGEVSQEIREVHRRLAYMSAGQRMERAVKGSREERRILIGDVVKPVREAVLKCPTLSEQEVRGFAMMTNLDDELFRKIATTPEWLRKYSIVLAIVSNPSAPPDVAVGLVKYLRLRDLKQVMSDRNLSEAVRVGARKLYLLKRR